MICGLCGKEKNGKRIISGIPICEECFGKLTKLRNSDYETIDYFSNQDNLKRASKDAIVYINETLERKMKELKMEDRLIQKKNQDLLAEQEKQSYAKKTVGSYEYEVVTIINKEHGLIDKDKMNRILQDHAMEGWRLHTIYSNELGKNAIKLLGLGINSTACEDVLIFERKIKNNEE